MSSKSLLAYMAAFAAMSSQEEHPVFMGRTPPCDLVGDFSKNITSYHPKPLRKGAFKKKLSRKQRKQLNENKRRR